MTLKNEHRRRDDRCPEAVLVALGGLDAGTAFGFGAVYDLTVSEAGAE